MKNKISYKILFIFVGIVLALLFMSNKSNAASVSISTSKSSVSPGEKFKVTVSVSGGAGYMNLSASNATLSSTSLNLMLQSSVTVDCTAGNSGTITISASGVIADYETEVDENKSTSKTVKIVSNTPSSGNSGGSTSSGGSNSSSGGSSTPAKKSSNANLSNLGIKPNDFTGFSAGKTTYNVTVPNDVSSVSIYATKADSKASVSGTGKKSLKEGTNVCKVVVTAEDGTKKTYTINITRKVAESETVPNVIDGEGEEDSEQEGLVIGLQTLTIEGLNLDKEFKTDVFEYTSVLEDETMTVEKLKELIKFTLNDETVKSDIEIVEGKEEDDYLFLVTISVKDDEKQFSSYKIKFVAKEEETEEKPEEVSATTEVVEEKKDDLNSGKTPRLFGLFLLNDTSKNVLKIYACELVTIIIAIAIAIMSYLKTRKLDNEDNYEFDDETDENEFNKMNKYSEDLASQAEEELEDEKNRRQGYRSLKNSTKIKPGRHF